MRDLLVQVAVSLGIASVVMLLIFKVIKPILIKRLLKRNDLFRLWSMRNGFVLLWNDKFTWYFGFPEFDELLKQKKQEYPTLEVIGCFTRKGNDYALTTFGFKTDKFNFSKIDESRCLLATSDCLLLSPETSDEEFRKILEDAQVQA